MAAISCADSPGTCRHELLATVDSEPIGDTPIRDAVMTRQVIGECSWHQCKTGYGGGEGRAGQGASEISDTHDLCLFSTECGPSENDARFRKENIGVVLKAVGESVEEVLNEFCA